MSESTNNSATPEDPKRAAQMSRAQPGFAVGDHVPGLSSWLLERRLGGGGFGEVWLAKHEFTGARRAVKFCTHPDARNQLVTHEKKVVARVMKHAGNHANIVPLLEHNLDGDLPWLMYEYVEGGTLADTINGWKPLSVEERVRRAIRTLHTLAGALAAFHQLDPPIVHRDLKPQNVLMAGEVPRITDFGIGGAAIEVAITESKTCDSAALPSQLRSSGSLKYASPEQMFGSAPNPRDDVFSVGVIAYQMLVADTKYAPGTDATDELTELNVPRELISLIVKSVAINADRRPKDAGEWEVPLATFLSMKAPPVPAGPPSDRKWSLLGEARVPPRPPVQVAPPSDQKWPVMVPGTWHSRPSEETKAEWVHISTTPATITLRPGEVYHLVVSKNVNDITLAGLVRLKGLTVLQSLDLSSCDKITDAGAVHLKGLSALQTLSLSNCNKITDAGLAHLKGLPALQSLDLSDCEQLTGAGLGHLKGLFALQSLDLCYCNKLTDAGLAHLKELSALQSLNLRYCEQLTDAGLAHLKGLSALQTLDLSDCEQLTGAGLAHLKGLSALQSLSLSRCKRLTDAGLEHLKELSALRWLGLAGCTQLTGTGLAHLKRLSALQSLNLSHCTKLTDVGIAELRKALPNCKIYR